MSTRVLSWVMENAATTNSREHGLLVAVADDAGHDGLSCAPIDVLAHHARMHRSTVLRTLPRLEQIGELVVRRPEIRAHGRTNEYVVVMGRCDDEINAVRRAPTRHRDNRPGAVPGVTQRDSHRGVAEASESGAVPTEVVDSHDPTPGYRSQPATEERLQIGSRSVALERPLTYPVLAVLPTASLQRAREAPPVEDQIKALAGRFADAGLHVTWDLSDDQKLVVVSLLAVMGEPALREHAQASVRRHQLPRSVRAWLPGWQALAPRPAPAAGRCGHGVPPAACPECTPARRAATATV